MEEEEEKWKRKKEGGKIKGKLQEKEGRHSEEE